MAPSLSPPGERVRPLHLFLLIFFLLFLPSFAEDLPRPTDYVNDFAGVVDGRNASRMRGLFRQLREKTGAEIAVVTVAGTGGIAPAEFANELFAKWGIGQRGKDNGVLILLAVAERKVRIEPGYGLEGVLPDGLCGEIIKEVMLPHFAEGEYGKGLWLGSAAVAQRIASEYGVELSDQRGDRITPYSPRTRSPCGGLLSAFLFFLFLLFLLRGRFLFPLLLGMGMGRGFWSGGSFGGGGFGGGFGGFGGGSSGGGGATGSW